MSLIYSNIGTASAFMASTVRLLIGIMRVTHDILLRSGVVALLALRINSGKKPYFAHFLVCIGSQRPHH